MANEVTWHTTLDEGIHSYATKTLEKDNIINDLFMGSERQPVSLGVGGKYRRGITGADIVEYRR